MLIIKLQSDAEYLEIDIYGREHPGNDYYDANWLKVSVKINASGFWSDFRASFRTEEFVGFYDDLVKFSDSSVEKVEFATMEEQLYLSGTLDYTGNINWEGFVIPRQGNKPLPFEFQTDNASLSKLINQLKDVIRDYPVVGRIDQ